MGVLLCGCGFGSCGCGFWVEGSCVVNLLWWCGWCGRGSNWGREKCDCVVGNGDMVVEEISVIQTNTKTTN